MITVTRRHGAVDRWNSRRARRLVDTALRRRRLAQGLSVAAPVTRAFARAGAWSLLSWAAILIVAAAR